MRVEVDDIICAQARARGQSVRVFLDGGEVIKPIWADDETGEVECLVLDANGNPQINPSKEDEVWTQVLSGSVEIKIG